MREENCHKKSTVQNQQKESSSLKASLENELDLIDFPHVSTLFFGINVKTLKSKSFVYHEKIYKLIHENKKTNDPEKVIFNFSKYELSDIEQQLLGKSLNFCLTPEKLIMYN